MDLNCYKEHQKILVAVDCIIFGFNGSEVKALLIKRGFEPEKGKWSLMGGFVKADENAEEAAARVLNQLTGMEGIYLEQLHTFTEVDRDSAARVISIAYFALINSQDYSEELQFEHEAQWFHLDSLPSLIFDHRKMVLKAKKLLRQKVKSRFELLPKKFTLPQLQSLYEAIYETPLDKRNFVRKIHSLGILKKLNEKEKESSRRGAFYYILDNVKLGELQSDEVKFI